MSRWRGRRTRPTARCSSCATSPPAQTRALTQDWDRSVDSIAWAPDGRSLLVTAGDTLEEPVFRVDAATGKVTRLTGDGHYGNVHALAGGGALATMNSIAAPDDLYRIDAGGRTARLTDVNRELLAQLDPVTFTQVQLHRAPTATPSGAGP